MEDSATAYILDLPPELVVDILTTLDKSGQKRFRLVSKGCATLTAPLLFEHICFDFDIGGTNGLVAISRQPELCQHVHTLELRRRDGLRSFDDTDAWRAATVYEYAFDTPEDGDVEIPAGAMTHDEWVMLPNEAVQKLYDAYESDRQAVVGYTSRLCCALSAITDVVISGAHETLADFGRAITRLSSASHVVHSSRYMDDDWGLRWRNVQFHHFGIMEGSTGADEDVDNIQLFAALHSIMLSTDTVTSVQLRTCGHAFWSAAHLRRLLDWSERAGLRWDPVDEGLDQWIDAIGGPLRACQHIEAGTRHLVRIGSAFSRLATPECSVDTVGADGSGELATIAAALSNMLQQATNLQSLQLSFCELAWYHSLQRPGYSDGHSSSSPSTGAWLSPLLSASAHLFAGIIRSQASGRLRRLELTLTTIETHLSSLLRRLPLLRHLALRRVAILPRQGHRESLFQKLPDTFGWKALSSYRLRMSPTAILDCFWSPQRQRGLILGRKVAAIHATRMLLSVSLFANRHCFHLFVRKILSVSTVKSVVLDRKKMI
ncbi:hypothetical protein LTR53_000022 [Teratosphaeriaceae sp. CCFEE 6253]|nr:hypothetical protein LTR53_000022 [Teratosphaeriaceae sp. CCFEE 6253]